MTLLDNYGHGKHFLPKRDILPKQYPKKNKSLKYNLNYKVSISIVKLYDRQSIPDPMGLLF